MNKRLMYHEKGYQKDSYIKIRNLYKAEKYNVLIKRASEYLNLYPDDINVRFMRAKAYRELKMFDESINDLKYNLGITDSNSIQMLIKNKQDIDEHSLSALYFNYYYLNRYESALELLPLMYHTNCLKNHSVFISELIMRVQLGQKVNIDINKNLYSLYTQNQVLNYSEEAALRHIKEHLNEKEDKSTFNEGIDLDYLFNLIRNNLCRNKRANKQEILEIYYFSIANVGYFEGMNCSFIKVVVVPNTKNIISMYPTNEVEDNSISNVECDYKKLFPKKEEKVKTLSRIDKFNAKYNILK